MSEDKSKLQLIGKIAQANNKNLELIEELNDREDEIERLNQERNKLYENGLNYFLELQEKKEEIERLNNIINELEKFINTEVDYIEYVVDPILDKLQELKGNNNGAWVNNLLEVIKENNIEFGSNDNEIHN